MKFTVVIPVHHGTHLLPRLLDALAAQTARPSRLLIAETEPGPEVEALARQAGAEYVPVAARDYDHAGTRSALCRAAGTEAVVLLSQDAVPANADAIARLLAALEDPGVGATFGRQMAPPGVHPFTSLKREFLYGDRSRVLALTDRARLGFSTAFFSNAFAAWRSEALRGVGYFGERRLMCEDVATAGTLLLAGWRLAYVGDACVLHANDHGLGHELRRYFDIGACHAHDRWLRESFGTPRREGVRFVGFGLRWLLARGLPHRVPGFALHALAKQVAYSLGRHHARLPASWRPRLSSFPGWWQRPTGIPPG